MKKIVSTGLLSVLLLGTVGFASAQNQNANDRALDNPSNNKDKEKNNNSNNGNNGVGGPNGNMDKVVICHGTNSATNAYVQITVDADAADGDTGNDRGQGDHSTHTGPVAGSQAEAQSLKDSKTAWGDIIPPHHNFGGLNWDAEGQSVYNNGCQAATTVATPTPTPTITTGVGGVTQQGQTQGQAATRGVMGLSQTSSSEGNKELLILAMAFGLIAAGSGLILKNKTSI